MRTLIVLIFIFSNIIFFGCQDSSDNLLNIQSNETQQNISPEQAWNSMKQLFQNGKALVSIRSDGIALPQGFSFVDSIIKDYRGWPTSGSKTTFTYTVGLNVQVIEIPWTEAYMSMGYYHLPLKGEYTDDGTFILFLGDSYLYHAVWGISPEHSLNKMWYPNTDPHNHCLKPIEIKINHDIVVFDLYCPAHGIYYNEGMMTYDAVLNKTKLVYWEYPYTYYY